MEDGPLKQFLDEAGDLGPGARGELLARSEAVVRAHTEAVTSDGGDQGADHHLVCFVRAGDQVYDMDSLASKPHWVAECEDETWPDTAIRAARAYLDRWITRPCNVTNHNAMSTSNFYDGFAIDNTC